MKRSKPRTLHIGSVSSGTMRPEDLIPAFLDAADSLRLSKSERSAVNAIRHVSELPKNQSEDADYWKDADSDLSELFDILDSHCPPFCYFGAHEGDGADYGCWPSLDSLEDAVREGEVLRVSDGGWRCGDEQDDTQYNHSHSIPEGLPYRFRMVVSDHGNVSLYYRNGREVWGIV